MKCWNSLKAGTGLYCGTMWPAPYNYIEKAKFNIFFPSFESLSLALITARIRRMEKVLFSQVSVCSHLGGGGYPFPGRGGGVAPSQIRMGVPLPKSDRGNPLPDLGRGTPILTWDLDGGYPVQVPGQDRGWGTPYWNSIACTSYMVGGIPLVFMQDFCIKSRNSPDPKREIGAWNKIQFKDPTHVWLAELNKHQTSKSVMVSFVSLIFTGGKLHF